MPLALTLLAMTALTAAPPKLELSAKTGAITVNAKPLKDFQRATLEAVLGKPDRVIDKQNKSYIEEFAGGGLPPTSTPVTMKDIFIVYDKLGLLFTGSEQFGTPEPRAMYVRFRNRRTFDNWAQPAVQPTSPFPGQLFLDGTALDPDVPVPAMKYTDREVPVWGALFSPTSIATVVDGLYLEGGALGLRVFLDDGKLRRLSWLTIGGH